MPQKNLNNCNFTAEKLTPTNTANKTTSDFAIEMWIVNVLIVNQFT